MLWVILFTLLQLKDTLAGPQVTSGSRNECSDYADFSYFCVPYFTCDEDSKIITDGTELLDPRVGDVDCSAAPSHETATTSRCPKLTERCCLHPKAEKMNTCGKKNCGKRNLDGVVGVRSTEELSVDEAEFGEFPHMCAVLQKKILEGQEVMVYLCGGSLIEGQVLLTAAHCIQNLSSSDLMVRCGEWDTHSEGPLPYQEIDVDLIKIHPCFINHNHHQNFALIFTKSKFRETDHISPVCLPEPSREWPVGQICISNGWGKDKFGEGGTYSNILKKVEVPLLKNPECQELLRDTRLGPFFELDSSFLCAGGEKNIDTCKGDGGSPLTCEQADGSWVQAGIVSWGIGCGIADVPAVYSSVSTVACWIDSKVSCYLGSQGTFFGYTAAQCGRRGCDEAQNCVD